MQEKVVVMTGATSGIGAVAAEKLAVMGARIVAIADTFDAMTTKLPVWITASTMQTCP